MYNRRKKSDGVKTTSDSNNEAEEKCIVCVKLVKSDDLGMQCEICELWAHAKCENISETEYTFLGKHKSLHWYCNECNKNVAKIVKVMSTVQAKVDKLDNDVTDIKKDVIRLDQVNVSISSELNIIKQELKDMKDAAKVTETKLETAIEAKLVDGIDKALDGKVEKMLPSWSSVVAQEVSTRFQEVNNDITRVKEVINDVKKNSDEEKDKELRSCNIIVYRSPEGENNQKDREFCFQLFTKLNVNISEGDIRSIFRIGKKDSGKGRPILIQFKEKSTKNIIMESLSKLKDTEEKFKNVSITHDMTKTEREECKTLVAEAKKKQSESGEYLWKVRGPPGQMRLIKLRK